MSRAALDERRAISNLMELLPVPGVSCEEREIADKIIEILTRHGLPKKAVAFDSAHKKSAAGGEVGNLIIKLPGKIKGPRRMLLAHMDTVPICCGSKPVRRGNFIVSARKETGVGADNRGGVGAVVSAVVDILEGKLPHPPLTLLFTVQEEIGLVGARHVNTRMLGAPKLAFNWDGGQPGCVEIGATGGDHLDIDVTGIPAHAGGQPEQGVSASTIAGLAIADLERNGWLGLVMKGGIRGTSNIGIIEGGNATNVVMDRLHIAGECRSYSVALRRRIAEAYRKAFEKAARLVATSENEHGSVAVTCIKKYETFRLPKKSACMSEVVRALQSLGMAAELSFSNGGLDANWLAERGIHAATLGAGSLGAHTANDRVVVDQYLSGCRVALALATGM